MNSLKLKDLDLESNVEDAEDDVNIIRLVFFQRDRVNMKKSLLFIVSFFTILLFVGSIVITYYSSTRISKIVETTVKTTAAQINYRLPRNFEPIKYDLEIKTYIGFEYEDNFRFDGIVTMHLKCLTPTNKIVFHSKNLQINDSILKSDEDANVKIARTSIADIETDFVIIYLKDNCKEGAIYKLMVTFNGIIANELFGFYKSSYTDSNKTEH